ncbi:MAG: hypothetical protein HY843_03625 [Bdellovibrio sp.]|nr:hypothetical protein [Bdellovibrio sp.]
MSSYIGQKIDTKVLHPLVQKSKTWQIREKLIKILPKNMAATLPHHLDLMSFLEWISMSFQRRGWRFYIKLLTIFLCTFFIADLTALLVEKYIPEPPPARPVRFREETKKTRTLESYQTIFSRNLFNSQGLIPGDNTSGPSDASGPPVRTILPLNLIGTLILKDELRSIATIEDKSQNMVFPVRVEDEIPAKIKVLKIESRRVTFVNILSGRKEFVELPDDPALMNPRITLGGSKSTGPGIEKVSPNQFNITRAEVDKALGNLNEILTQARCVPNFEGGVPAGYKCFQIVSGSIYDKLGLQNDDVIMKINGQDITDPAQAFQHLASLKEANHFEMQVKRGGKPLNYTYEIR